MKTETTGTIVAGTLKLDERLNLPDNSRVRVALEPLEEWQARFQSGLKAWRKLCEDHRLEFGGRRYTRDELHERD
jgi:hypothetical protein